MENNTLCGIQIPGEICIAGDGIALGYLNRPKLTDERFVQNPFGEGKMYRSGDLGRWTEDGNVEYLGRLDSQIKIRGFRVELAEVENALLQIEGVNTATVIAYEKENRNLILLAFYTGEQRNEADIKVMLAQSLPNYMIPSKCLWMNVIPMNTSGKINRQKLIEFYKQHLVYTSKNKDYSGWTNAQKLVKAIWEEVLEEEVTELTQDFFDMGGNSLNLFSVADKMEKQGVIVSVSELYQYPTLELLASEIVEEQLSGGEIIELKPLVNEVVFVDGLHENQDTFSWSDVNCYYKPRAICHGKYKKDFYNEYLMMLSFCAIYQVENLFGSFDEKERQEAVERTAEKCRKAGALKVVYLNVSGPFHSELMAPAGELLKQELDKVTFRSMVIPYVSNVTADYVKDQKAVKILLEKQVTHAVHWEQSMRRLLKDEPDAEFLEMGPGKALKGFARQIDRKVKVIGIGKLEDLVRYVEKE